MFLSAKNGPKGPTPWFSIKKSQPRDTPKKGGRPPWGRPRNQEYRITLRCNTACNFKLRALARAAGIPRTEVLRQLILYGSVRERLRSEHLEWLVQLKGLARNLNQLTRLAHAQGFAAVAARHATLQAELVRMIEALRRDR